ncbi:tyrosine-type recombinase/integrase [Nocardiopsis alba]|uniref:tyrosine-type recombinase/integrase n=1 Tax=Nocardiopsis alba TaxID=53437 RepID=UPI0036A72C7E
MTSLATLVDDYRAHLKSSKKRSPLTLQAYLGTITKFSACLSEGMDTDVEEIRPRHLRDWLGGYMDQGKTSSAKTYYERLRSFFNWCVREEELTKSPLAKVDPPQHNEQAPEIMPEDEVRSLIKACDVPLAKNPSSVRFDNARDTAAIRIMLDIGPRASETAGILLDNIDLKAPSIRIVGKGGKVRTLPLGTKAESSLRKYLRLRRKHRHADSPFLFLGQRGALGYHGIWAIVDRRAKAGRIRHIRPHVLRHTFAHYFRLFEGSEGDLMYLGGWSRREMVDRYAKTGAQVRAHAAHKIHSPGDHF